MKLEEVIRSYWMRKSDETAMASCSQEQMRKMVAPLLTIGEEVRDIIFPSVWQVPEGYVLEKFQVKGVPVEHLIPKDKKSDCVIYHLHGGGYEFRYMDPYRDAALKYSEVAGNAEVFSIDYHCAPSHVFPSALNEAVDVYEWILEQGYSAKNIVMLGDSAGGNLTLVTTMYLRDHNRPLPRALVTLSPWTCLESAFESRNYNNENDLLLGAGSAFANTMCKDPAYVKDMDKSNPLISPVYGDFSKFPPILVQCGGYEIFLDEITEFANKAKAAGVEVTFTIYEEMSHDFQIFLPTLQESLDAWNEMQQFFDSVSIKTC